MEITSETFVQRIAHSYIRFSSSAQLNVVEFITSSRNKLPVLGVPVKNEWLSAEHAKAVSNLLLCRNQVMVLRGSAGGGKTVALAGIIEGSADDVQVFAPPSKAAEVLQKDGEKISRRASRVLAEAQTVQALLQSSLPGAGNTGTGGGIEHHPAAGAGAIDQTPTGDSIFSTVDRDGSKIEP